MRFDKARGRFMPTSPKLDEETRYEQIRKLGVLIKGEKQNLTVKKLLEILVLLSAVLEKRSLGSCEGQQLINTSCRCWDVFQ
jgi:hypothetical protein